MKFSSSSKAIFLVLLQQIIQKTALKSYEAKCVNPWGTLI
jgi:hypothetical protein